MLDLLTTQAIAAFTLALLGGLHCAGMCGGFAAGPLAIPLVGIEDGFAFALTAAYVALVAFASIMLGRAGVAISHDYEIIELG